MPVNPSKSHRKGKTDRDNAEHEQPDPAFDVHARSEPDTPGLQSVPPVYTERIQMNRRHEYSTGKDEDRGILGLAEFILTQCPATIDMPLALFG